MKSWESDRNQLITRFLTDDKFRIYRHLLLNFWILSIFFTTGDSRETIFIEGKREVAFCIVTVVIIALIYFNMYVLTPRIFFKGHYLKYGLVLVLMTMVALTTINGTVSSYTVIDPEQIPVHLRIQRYYSHTLLIVSFILTTTMFKLLQRWIRDTKRMDELRTLTHQMELNELKSQITPHFLFNMLNNIKALTRKDSNMASEVIIKLSDLLRYQIYDSSEESVPLRSEILFIENFLSLEKVRRDNFEFMIQHNLSEAEAVKIHVPPHLFTPFVENALKHSVLVDDTLTKVNVLFTKEKDQLVFVCNNTKPKLESNEKSKYGGLGLRNIKRRLELLYPDKNYNLSIIEKDFSYEVNLTVTI